MNKIQLASFYMRRKPHRALLCQFSCNTYYIENGTLESLQDFTFDFHIGWASVCSTRQVAIRALFCNICLCFGQYSRPNFKAVTKYTYQLIYISLYKDMYMAMHQSSYGL